MIPFLSALSCGKMIKNGTLSAPGIPATAPAQAIVFLTVTRHSGTRDPETFCSPALALNETRVCFSKKKPELISAQLKPGDRETGAGAQSYGKIRGEEGIRSTRKKKILFISQEDVMNRRERKKSLDKALLKRKNSAKCWLNSH